LTEVFLEGRVVASCADITTQRVDAIVNAANSSLLGGSGVDGAIHRAGGPAILAACRELRRAAFPSGLPTGAAVITPGGRLPASFVIHTVGPVYGTHSGQEAALLASCYQRSLALAHERHLHSVAFPSIATGAFGYPREEAARVSSEAIAAALVRAPGIREVRLVFFSAQDLAVFLAHQAFLPPATA
jgi:O-acetyl-ADP-ribose deacetylase (regulator of RNase III)